MDFNWRVPTLVFGAMVVLQCGISAFNFPDNGPPPPVMTEPMIDGSGLERQAITPAIVTPTNSCICVPTGRCTFGTTGNTDGSGLIDIRIVNSVNFMLLSDLKHPPENSPFNSDSLDKINNTF